MNFGLIQLAAYVAGGAIATWGTYLAWDKSGSSARRSKMFAIALIGIGVVTMLSPLAFVLADLILQPSSH